MKKLFKILLLLAGFGVAGFAGYMTGFTKASVALESWEKDLDETPEAGDASS